ncbi:MAG: glycoside hydrolase family 108 protein [Sphingorhabdus sp.]
MRLNPEEIIVNGWSKRFAQAVEHVLKIEGGFVDHPNDPGGATKYGISLRFLKAEGKIDMDGDGIADFDLDFDGDIDGIDIRNLTLQDARVLYHRCFWQAAQCDALPPPVGEMVFDQAINGGLHAARKMLQHAINDCLSRGGETAPDPVKVDGAIGPRTIEAMNWVVRWGRLGTNALVVAYREEARMRYIAIADRNPKLKVFLKGWLRRADQLGRSA